VIQWLGRVGLAFLLLAALYAALGWIAPGSLPRILVGLGVLVSGIWLAVRLLRMLLKQAVWRLRNRLLVTYLFIAGVPILLIVTFAAVGSVALANQLAIYLVTSELDRRIDSLQTAADSVVRSDPAMRPSTMERMIDLIYRDRYPGIEILLRESGRSIRYPEDSSLPAPRDGWPASKGVLLRDGAFYLWSYAKTQTGDVTVTAPLTPELLAGLVPNLGVVEFRESGRGRGSRVVRATSTAPSAQAMPPQMNRLDTDVSWFATVPTADWDRPGPPSETCYLVVRSRISAVLATVFSRKADLFQGVLQTTLIVGPALFLGFGIISLVIGFTTTRTITGAVHRLYEGTNKVIEGDFSHRIEVRGNDQLGELSQSFNRMTENLERLLVVAKEKERLQSEIEIASEVQNRLYPRVAPHSRSLRLTAICQPARTVSGDYYDYEMLRESQVALAIADVAGKGISAALLMATLQSSFRAQLQSSLEMGAAAGDSAPTLLSVPTSLLVSRMNAQLYSYTSAEKYATLCLGIFDEPSGDLTYTNAGHLPPILVHEGTTERLDVNGTVVGAFPFSKYDESKIHLHTGDLLVFFTDGISEPENEYGEMFGEDRLAELVARNAHLRDDQIIEVVLESVHNWTASEELQDDMTLLLARRI